MTSASSSNPNVSPSENQMKEAAPGAKTGRICGILAIVLALTCVGIPIAIILGIIAIVKTGKARGLARSYPETYEMPNSAGLILGIVGLCLPIVMLPFAGIVSAIAVPALLGQRARARDHALMVQWAQVRSRAEIMAMESHTSGTRPLRGEEAITLLMADTSLKALKNTHNPGEAVLINGPEPRPGTIALSPAEEIGADGTVHSSVVLRAHFGPANKPALREEKIKLGTTPSAQRFTDVPNH